MTYDTENLAEMAALEQQIVKEYPELENSLTAYPVKDGKPGGLFLRLHYSPTAIYDMYRLRDFDLVRLSLEADFKARTDMYFTTAPEDYDGFGTKTMSLITGTFCGKPIIYRAVRIYKEHVEYQLGRYVSGMYYCGPRLAFDNCPDLAPIEGAA